MNTIIATEGYVFRRIHDGFIMGEIIHLGIDFSTGTPREDKPEYYEETPKELDDIMNKEGIFRILPDREVEI